MQTVGRLSSDGVLFVSLVDEISSPSRNVGIDENGIFYSNSIKEGEFSELPSNIPMRIGNDKELKVYGYIDELSGLNG